MSIFRNVCLGFVALALGASSPDRGTGSLDYRVKMRMQGEAGTIETRFTLIPTSVAATANRVKKARMGAWRLEARQVSNATFSQAMVLARVERLLYFSGPTAQTERHNPVVRSGEKPCRIWTTTVPKGLSAYAYLAEVAPGLLALSYFSGTFLTGDVASLEIQLEGFRLDSTVAPSEAGTQLLRTLECWRASSASAAGD